MDENNSQLNGNKDNLKTVRTYLGDMANTVRENEISVIKVALAEQNKHEREDLYRQIEGSPTKKVFWFIGGLFFIALSVYGVYFVLNKKAAENLPAPIIEQSIISYDTTSNLEIINLNDLTQQLIDAKNETANGAGIKSISLFKKDIVSGLDRKVDTDEIFTDLNLSAPGSLIRSFTNSYMIGFHGTDKPHPFIIFQTKDYEYSYAGMLEWESSLASDMSALFELAISGSKLDDLQWKDVIINNKDARVLFDENNKPILYYLFADKENLIIADNENTIKEIISRLMIKNIKPL